MKIGIVLRACRDFGSSKYVIETTKYFAKDHEVHVFTNEHDTVDDRVILHHVPAIKNINFLFREMSFTAFSSLILKKYSFDVVLAQPTRLFSPTVAEVQICFKAWIDDKKKNNYPVTFEDKLLPPMEGYNLRKARQVITLSNVVKQQVMEKYGIDGEKIHPVHSGVDSQKFNPKNREKYFKEIRDRHNISYDDLVLILAGNPFLSKGLPLVIDALPNLKEKNVKLIVAGKDNEKPFVTQAEKLGVKDKMIFIGRTTEMEKYFAASDIFILPTMYDAFGLVIIEAMASGLPVVVSQIAGAAELITDGKDGLLIKDQKDSKEVAEKLNYLIENNSIKKKIGSEARKTAEKTSWEVTAKKMLDVFELSLKR